MLCTSTSSANTENVRNRRDAELLAEVGGAGEGLHKGEALFSAHGSRVLKSTESALHWVYGGGVAKHFAKWAESVHIPSGQPGQVNVQRVVTCKKGKLLMQLCMQLHLSVKDTVAKTFGVADMCG